MKIFNNLFHRKKKGLPDFSFYISTLYAWDEGYISVDLADDQTILAREYRFNREADNFFDKMIEIGYIIKYPQKIQQWDILKLTLDLGIDHNKYKVMQNNEISLFNSIDYRLVIDKIKRFNTLSDLSLYFEAVDGEFTIKIEEDNFIYWFYLLVKAFDSKEEIEVIVDISNNKIMDIKYPVQTLNTTEPEIQERLIPKKIVPPKKTSSIKLPDHPLLNTIEKVDFDRQSIGLIKHSDVLRYYFTQTQFWSMELWHSEFKRKDGVDSFDFPEERVKNFFKEFEVTVDDLHQTIKYLIDIEELEKVKAFLPSFYIDYPAKTFISFFRITDSFKNSLLEGWTGRHENFFHLIPKHYRYWIVDGKDWSDYFYNSV